MSNTIGKGDIYKKQVLGSWMDFEVDRFDDDKIKFSLMGTKTNNSLGITLTDAELEKAINNGSMKLLSKG